MFDRESSSRAGLKPYVYLLCGRPAHDHFERPPKRTEPKHEPVVSPTVAAWAIGHGIDFAQLHSLGAAGAVGPGEEHCCTNAIRIARYTLELKCNE